MSGLSQPITYFKSLKLSKTSVEKDVTQWILDYMREKALEMVILIACTEAFDNSGSGAVKMCNEMRVPFLGKVPLDSKLCKAAEEVKSCFGEKDLS
uniref:Uncharacterized protein n=1 Tax=Lotus japonicus TaxID=34305 RepID=I3SG80_LOTJA|nr:unknown [Lotus japonicus]